MDARDIEQVLRLPAVSILDAVVRGVVYPLFLDWHAMRAGELRRIDVAQC